MTKELTSVFVLISVGSRSPHSCVLCKIDTGSIVTFVTPIDRYLKAFLKARARKVRRPLWQRHWELTIDRGSGAFSDLILLAEEHQVTGLAVWFLAYDREGTLLLEAEDGNDYLWLSDGLQGTTKERLIASVGGAVSRVENVGSTP